MTELDRKSGHIFHGDAVWEHAREAYRLGASGPDVSAHYGLRLSTFRARARREGWRRGDMSGDPGAYPADYEVVHETLDAPAMAEAAWRAASEAVRKGRLREAQGWTRLARELRLQSQAEHDTRARAEGYAPRPAPLTAAEAAPIALSAPVCGATPAGLEQVAPVPGADGDVRPRPAAARTGSTRARCAS